MKLLKLPIYLMMFLLLVSCGSGGGSGEKTAEEKAEEPEVPASIKEGKGIGEIKHVELSEELNQDMVESGGAIYDMKCASCHKLTDQRVVGPGFQGVTNRRKPEWIMNMITNVDMMLAQDPTAQALLEECLTRMPNQNVSKEDARKILEFFRSNDLEKTGQKDEAIES